MIKNQRKSLHSSSDHCHSRNVNLSGSVEKAKRKLITAALLCVAFMITEIVGGVLSGSLAIATDAAHLLTDLAAFMISLFALWVGQKPPNQHLLFGWYRAEVIGALTSVLTIWLITGILVYMAVLRIIHGTYEIDAMIMLIAAGIGVIVNIIMAFALHESSNKHHHNIPRPSGSVDVIIDDRKNINVRAALIHVIGDIIQSFGVFIAALIVYFKEDWKIVDPICTFLFSILVLFTTYNILKDILIVLMEGTPNGSSYLNSVIRHLMNIDGVVAIHNIRIWALSLDKTALAVHLVIDPKYNSDDILNAATHTIRRNFNFFEHTIQVELYKPSMKYCIQCQQFPVTES